MSLDSRQGTKGTRSLPSILTLMKEHCDWDAKNWLPSLLVDQMWHLHILEVTNYNHDVILLCGHLVGHNPDRALSGNAERDETTHKALEQRFPNYDKEIWGIEVNQANSLSNISVASNTGD